MWEFIDKSIVYVLHHETASIPLLNCTCYSTHLMLAPAMRAKLIAELEYQHENAATPANMVKEDPLNYEAYATVRYCYFTKMTFFHH